MHDLQQHYINQGNVGQCHNGHSHKWNKPRSPEIRSKRDSGHNYGKRNLFPQKAPAKSVEEESEPELKAHTV